MINVSGRRGRDDADSGHAWQRRTGTRPRRPLSPKHLRDPAVIFLLAGHETTALALSWTLALLSRHPTVRDRLEAELAAVLGGRDPTADDVGALPVTTRVLKEAMQRYPPAYAFARQASADVAVDGVRVRKGATPVVSQWVTQRDPRWFDRPDLFDPGRWDDDLDPGVELTPEPLISLRACDPLWATVRATDSSRVVAGTTRVTP
jgi:cytochrome P450